MCDVDEDAVVNVDVVLLEGAESGTEVESTS